MLRGHCSRLSKTIKLNFVRKNTEIKRKRKRRQYYHHKWRPNMSQVRQIVMIKTEGFGERKRLLVSNSEIKMIVVTNTKIAVIVATIVTISISRRTT